MSPKMLYSQVGYKMNEHLFDCLTCTISRCRKAAGKTKLPDKEYAAYGEAASPLGAFPPLHQTIHMAAETQEWTWPKMSEKYEDRDWAWEQTWTQNTRGKFLECHEAQLSCSPDAHNAEAMGSLHPSSLVPNPHTGSSYSSSQDGQERNRLWTGTKHRGFQTCPPNKETWGNHYTSQNRCWN